MSEIEEIIERIKNHKGSERYIILGLQRYVFPSIYSSVYLRIYVCTHTHTFIQLLTQYTCKLIHIVENGKYYVHILYQMIQKSKGKS